MRDILKAFFLSEKYFLSDVNRWM